MATCRTEITELLGIAAKPILQLLNTGLSSIPGASVAPQGLLFVVEAAEVSEGIQAKSTGTNLHDVYRKPK